MLTEKVPTEVFVIQVMATKSARQIMDDWPIKPEMLVHIVTKHIRDLNIYHVHPGGQDALIRQEILFFLKNSSIILEMIDKAKRAAMAAAERGRVDEGGQ
jgi:hypothetical protein